MSDVTDKAKKEEETMEDLRAQLKQQGEQLEQLNKDNAALKEQLKVQNEQFKVQNQQLMDELAMVDRLLKLPGVDLLSMPQKQATGVVKTIADKFVKLLNEGSNSYFPALLLNKLSNLRAECVDNHAIQNLITKQYNSCVAHMNILTNLDLAHNMLESLILHKRAGTDNTDKCLQDLLALISASPEKVFRLYGKCFSRWQSYACC